MNTFPARLFNNWPKLNGEWNHEKVNVYLSGAQKEAFTIALFDFLCTSTSTTWDQLNDKAKQHFRSGVEGALASLNPPEEHRRDG